MKFKFSRALQTRLHRISRTDQCSCSMNPKSVWTCSLRLYFQHEPIPNPLFQLRQLFQRHLHRVVYQWPPLLLLMTLYAIRNCICVPTANNPLKIHQTAIVIKPSIASSTFSVWLLPMILESNALTSPSNVNIEDVQGALLGRNIWELIK